MSQKERFKIIPAVYLILQKSEEVLLSRRFNTGFEDGNYSLVAGHVDEGESMIDCIVREAKEEADVIVKPENVSIVHMLHRVPLERISVFAIAKEWEGEIKNMEPDKCDDLSWFPINNLPPNIIPYIRRALESVQQKNFYNEEK